MAVPLVVFRLWIGWDSQTRRVWDCHIGLPKVPARDGVRGVNGMACYGSPMECLGVVGCGFGYLGLAIFLVRHRLRALYSCTYVRARYHRWSEHTGRMSLWSGSVESAGAHFWKCSPPKEQREWD